MKETIEKKLGCTIDEYIIHLKEKLIHDKENDLETDGRNKSWVLTEEERKYIMEYNKNNQL